MATLYEFSNSSNWQQVWTGQRVAKPAPSPKLKNFFPIPDFSVPVLLDNPVLAVYVTSDDDPGNWRRGGYLKQKVSTGLADGSAVDSYLTQVFLQLRKINIVQLQKINGSFAVELAVPFWFKQVEVTVWEYTGTIADTVGEQLGDLKTFITQCCEELKSLSETSTDNLGSQIGETLSKLSDSEVLLNQISSTLNNSNGGTEGSNDEIISRLTTIEAALNLLEDRTDLIGNSVVELQDIPEQIEFLNISVAQNNELTLTQINQLDAGLFTLASSLGSLLPSDKKAKLEADIDKRLDLNDDFLI